MRSPFVAIVAALCLVLGAGLGLQTWRLDRLQTQVAARAAEQAEADRMAERRITITHRSIDHAAAASNDRTTTAAVRAAAVGDGLRIAARSAADAAAPARCGPGAAAAAEVLADMPGRMDAAGREVAAHADRLATALDACRSAYAAAEQAHSTPEQALSP